jgi:hypothetical protein
MAYLNHFFSLHSFILSLLRHAGVSVTITAARAGTKAANTPLAAGNAW